MVEVARAGLIFTACCGSEMETNEDVRAERQKREPRQSLIWIT